MNFPKRKSLLVQQVRADMIHSNREIKDIFDPEKSPFPSTQSIKVHRRALVLLPCLIPCHRCKKSARESRSSHHFWPILGVRTCNTYQWRKTTNTKKSTQYWHPNPNNNYKTKKNFTGSYTEVNPHFWSRNVTTYTREPTIRAWSNANIWRQDGAICSKNRKIVPYHRSARIPRLTVSVHDYGSCMI